MIVAYTWNLNMYVCVNFGDEIILRGKECKTLVNLNFFSRNGKTVNCRYSTGYKPGIFLDLG